jgi:(2Fe-2S) ferredoxin
VTGHTLTDSSSSENQTPRQVLVCQHRTCRKDGSARVLAELQYAAPPDVEVTACNCLGLCGSGPMVLVTPENTYYWHVKPSQVNVLVEQHLIAGQPIKNMLHRRLHLEPEQFV